MWEWLAGIGSCALRMKAKKQTKQTNRTRETIAGALLLCLLSFLLSSRLLFFFFFVVCVRAFAHHERVSNRFSPSNPSMKNQDKTGDTPGHLVESISGLVWAPPNLTDYTRGFFLLVVDDDWVGVKISRAQVGVTGQNSSHKHDFGGAVLSPFYRWGTPRGT